MQLRLGSARYQSLIGLFEDQIQRVVKGLPRQNAIWGDELHRDASDSIVLFLSNLLITR